MKIFYVTGNKFKFERTQEYAKSLGIDLIQKKIDIKEIQSGSIKEIAKDKAKKAFKIIKKPLVVSDSGWRIPALKGFPGAYMHYINEWFTAEDFLNLMKGKKDKSIILNHVVCAVFKGEFKLFNEEFEGVFTDKIEGEGITSDRVVKMKGSKNTIAKNQNLGKKRFSISNLWEEVFNWF